MIEELHARSEHIRKRFIDGSPGVGGKAESAVDTPKGPGAIVSEPYKHIFAAEDPAFQHDGLRPKPVKSNERPQVGGKIGHPVIEVRAR